MTLWVFQFLGLWLFFVPLPTFRTSKESWNGDKIAFEQNLLDNGYKWFIYIKFYKDKKNNKIYAKPLVVGKSGSLKVNSSGSDLNFSTDVNDGPARQFLYENNKQWLYSYIAIKSCINRQDAYEKEAKVMKLLNLYGS